jgi:hypothetical protein
MILSQGADIQPSPLIIVVVRIAAGDRCIDRIHVRHIAASKAIGVATAGVIFAAHGALLSSVDVMSISVGSDI